MAQLTVRNIDDRIVKALKARASRAGRSAEAEHRRILQEVLSPGSDAGALGELRALRIKLPPGSPTTTDLLRADRDRDDTLPE